jgi:3-oxoadipate enol-lactonase
LSANTAALVALTAVIAGSLAIAEDSKCPRPAAQASRFLDVAGAKLYYEECGSGPAIVLLHEGLLASAAWDEVWQPLAAKHHVIRYDRRGYGRSDPATSSFSPVKDLEKLLRHLKVEHAVVAGSSSGGALAIDFAIEHPEMVK